MSLPIWVEGSNGHFTASVVGAPAVRAEAATRAAAVTALKAQIADRRTAGELLFVDADDPEAVGLAGLGDRHRNDPVWHDLWDETLAEIYRERDAEKAREFPE